eukprot:s621_g28.t1
MAEHGSIPNCAASGLWWLICVSCSRALLELPTFPFAAGVPHPLWPPQFAAAWVTNYSCCLDKLKAEFGAPELDILLW